MRKAALYARVSTGRQEKERTIESQIAELKKQVAKNGDVLVKEYIDDGHSGAKVDRPAMNRLRDDLEKNAFDAVYFLGTDRIARDVAYQTVIIGEVLKNGKKLIVGGRDFEKSPENDFTLTVLGAASQLERAKIIERNYRGKMHRLRQGFVHSNGHNTFGYDYVKKGADSPAKVVVNEREAKVVRYIFDAYANENASWTKLIRHLEDTGVPTKTGKKIWNTVKLAAILKNTSYAGTKYFNSRYCEKKSTDPLRKVRYGRKIYRNKSEWIAIKVPPIVEQRMFDKAQARLAKARGTYRRPKETRLLSGIVRCGECGNLFTSYFRTYKDKRRKLDPERVFHKSAYRCTRVIQQKLHSKKADIKRCSNSEVRAHLLENRVMEIVRETLTLPSEMGKIVKAPKNAERARIRTEKRLKTIEERIEGIGRDKAHVVDLYVDGKIDDEEYARRCRDNDSEMTGAKNERARITQAIPNLHKKNAVDASVRIYCEEVAADVLGSEDFDTKRDALRKRIEKVIFDRGRVTIYGSVPMRNSTRTRVERETARIPFSVTGLIKRGN